jgi:iron complex outermembrane recepter protein
MRNDDPKARLNPLLGWSTLSLAMMLATSAEADEASPSSGVAEILVRGSSTLNVDIRRTRDGIQPYVVFDAEQIARSAAQNVEDFLQSNLPMNSQQTTTSQLGPQTSPRGRIDLRGLGADQTLILVDGRRLPSISTGDSFGQPNINGISMSQVERIEILPATASGIYGGGATGGVINIILKRKYSGIDIDASYGNTFDSDVGQYRIGMNGGFTIEGGHTSVLFAASHSEGNVLLSSDRDFFGRGAELQLRNDPSDASVLFGGANICSTEDGVTCSAQPLALKGGGVLGSPFASVPDRYAGPAGDGGAALANNAGKLQFDRAGTPIWSAPDITAYSFNLRREFSNHFEAYADFSHDISRTVVAIPTQLPLFVAADSAENPFQQDVLSFLSIPNGNKQAQSVENTRANVGGIVRLPHDWSSSLEYSWLRNTTDSANSSVLGVDSPAADAVLQGAAFRDVVATPLTNPNSLFSFFGQSGRDGDTLQTVSLRMSGPVVDLPGGSLIATALLEGRDERSDSTVNAANFFGVDSYTWNPPAKRTVRSGYLELRAPIISEGNGVPWVNALEVMASARRDAYKTQFSGSSIDIDGPEGPFPPQVASNNDVSSTDFTLGFRYAPASDISFRASFGTGFLPPNLAQIRGEPPALFSPFLIFLLDLRDPARGDELIPGPLTVLSGGNPDLKPEQSDSASFGAVFTPDLLPGLRVSVDFTNIRKQDEITTLPLAFFIANDSAFPGRVVRDVGGGSGAPGPITQIDFSSLNLAKSELRALDIQADYKLSTSGFGSWRFYLVATNTLELSRTVLPTDASVDRVDFADGPLKWRGNVGFDWSKGAVGAGWNAQYYGGYRICSTFNSSFECGSRETSQGALRLPSQKYHDIYMRYSFPAKSGALANVDLRLGINNLFNDRGPTVASGIGFSDGPPSYVDPRLRRFTLVAHKHF